MEWKIKSFDELDPHELYEILRSRAEVFVAEQHICCADPDGEDYRSLHVFATENGRVTAYLRAYAETAEKLKVGRVLTLERGIGLGKRLMEFALGALPGLTGRRIIHIDAQLHAVGFYEKFGFVKASAVYLEEGVPHVDMLLEFPAAVGRV